MKKNKLNILYIFPKKKSAFHLSDKELKIKKKKRAAKPPFPPRV
jgi:hypothetical protein